MKHGEFWLDYPKTRRGSPEVKGDYWPEKPYFAPGIKKELDYCTHKWIKTEGLTKVYYDCSICGAKKEELDNKDY